jgi:type II secretory pathway pseudopilin PulG
MNNNKLQMKPAKPEVKLFTIHYSLFINKGITLMECLASVFVIGIGLLGVLAVIPYGSFQIAKAKNAEHTAWMLAGAADELRAMELAKPEKWVPKPNTGSNLIKDITGTANIFQTYAGTNPAELNCARFIIVDPFAGAFENISNTGNPYLDAYRVNTSQMLSIPKIREMMTGQDDLVYSRYPEDRRPDFIGQNNKVQSSGQYTWFFTYKPNYTCTDIVNHTHGNEAVPFGELNSVTVVDLIGCYNRVQGAEQVISIAAGNITPTLNGLQVELPSMPTDVDMKKIKYVFLSWGISPNIQGGWYKLVNVLNTTSTTPSLVLTGAGYTLGNSLEILFIEGTIYHKRLDNVNIK